MIPGIDLLDIAFGAIDSTPVTLYQWASRTLNDAGQWITTYATPVTIQASIQPIPKNEYQYLGLDLQKSYAKMYASNNTRDVVRDSSGDQIVWNGRRWQVESNTEWFAQDGWKMSLLVDIGAAS